MGLATAVNHANDLRGWSPPFSETEKAERMQSIDELTQRRSDLAGACDRLSNQISTELQGRARWSAGGVLVPLIAVAIVAALAGAVAGQAL